MDVINGGAGADTLNLNILNGSGAAGTAVNALPSVTISNVETMNIRAAVGFGVAGINDIAAGGGDNDNGTASVTHDFSGIAGLTNLNLTESVTSASIKAGATTDVKVSGATGSVEVVGGKNVVVTDATADKNITVGSSVAAAADNTNTAGSVVGSISITDTKQGSGVILVDGGTTVDVTASADKTSGAIVVGAVKAATGAVTVTQNTTSDNTAAITAGNINITGGSSVTVNVNSTNTATKDSTGVNNITAGSVTVTGDSKTTAVTVTQNHVANDYASVTTGDKVETSAVTFASLKSGEQIAISAGASSGLGTDLTFTAAKDLTAAEVAAAFANLTAADIQTSGGKVANGIFTGTLDAGWTSGAASGSTVTFSSVAKANETNEITLTVKKADGTTNVDNLASFTIVKVDGSAGTSTTARDLTTANGNVTIDDNATAAITDVTVNGYGTLNIGTTTALTKLANLSLANSGGTATVDAAAGITSLNMTVNNVKNAVDISTNSTTVATLNLTTATKDSAFALTAAQVKDLTVAGTNAADLTGSTLTALENVTVTGTAGLNLGAVVASKSITTTGTTGAVTATINGTAATYAGGAGVDTVTLATGTALTKAINTGAGDDTVVFGAAVTGSTAALNGGDGTDTLSMTTANADSLDASAQTFYTNFERLTLNNANTAALTVDVANLGFTNYVTTSGTGSVTYVGGVAALANGETFSFVYNGTTYTTGAVTVAGATVTAAELDTAIDATAVGAGKITASLTNGGADITLTVDTASDTLTSGVLDAAGQNITGTDQALTLNNLANNATVVLTKDGAITAVIKDSATGTADVLNVTANVAASNVDFGTLTAANVETINITANDTKADDNGDGTTTTAESAPEKATLTLTADKATTVNLGSSSADVALTLTGSTKVTLIDGSAMTGALTVTSLNTTSATTIKGGSANDTLTAATGTTADELMGGAGNDSLTANAGMTKMTGGAGADTFNITVASTNVNSAATIMDIGTGDVIKFGGAAGNDFKSAAISLDSTAVFQDYANAAIAAITVTDDLAWFQFGGNTYIVQEKNAGTNADVFVNNEDFIVKIAGTVDLSTASWNKTSGTLEIA